MDEQNYNNQYSGQPEQLKRTNALAVVGMILGIVSVVAGCCGWYGLFLGIPGLICSIMSRKQGKSGMGVAGIVCSAVGISFGLLMLIFSGVLMGYLYNNPEFNEIFRYYYNYGL